MSGVSQLGDSHFGEGLYRKRYLVTVITDRATDGGDDWASSIGDGLGSQHCLWDIEEVESIELTTPPKPLVGADDEHTPRGRD